MRGYSHEIKLAPVNQKLGTKVPSFVERKVLRWNWLMSGNFCITFKTTCIHIVYSVRYTQNSSSFLMDFFLLEFYLPNISIMEVYGVFQRINDKINIIPIQTDHT